MSVATAAMGFSRPWVAHPSHWAKNVCTAPRNVSSQNGRNRSVRAQARATVRSLRRRRRKVARGAPVMALRRMNQRPLVASQSVILELLQGPVLGPAHLVHRVVEVLREVAPVDDELRRGVVRIGAWTGCAAPHVHGDRRDPLSRDRRQGLAERVEAHPLPVLAAIPDPARSSSATTVR